MLHIKFQAPEPIGSKEEIFEYFSLYFYGSNPENPVSGPNWTLRPSF